MYKFFRKYHKWLGLAVGFFLLFFAVSGILMNHRNLISGFSVDRNLLPKEYRFENWNNAAIKGSCTINADSVLLFGDAGVWLTNIRLDTSTSFNKGFPKGADNRKVADIKRLSNGRILAATLLGLYELNLTEKSWQAMELPITEKRIVSLTQKQDSLYVLSRSHLLATHIGQTHFNELTIPRPKNYQNTVSLFRTIWIIHSGEIFGHAGKLVVDFMGIIFLILSISGFIYFFSPRLIKKWVKQAQTKKRWFRFNRFSLKWHNKLGLWLFPILVITATTGMFLRPPLLIPIAGKQVAPIPYTILEYGGVWHDKFRKIYYDNDANKFILFTSDGVFSYQRNQKPNIYPVQPPISVMGINVFEKLEQNTYLVGSFSGMFVWNPEKRIVYDFMNPQRSLAGHSTGRPIGSEVVAGFINIDNYPVYFDYSAGAIHLARNSVREFTMPDAVRQSGMSLWNFALEIHTARIYRFMLGDAYILIVPLVGLFTLFVLLSGLIVWLKYYWKPKSRLTNKQFWRKTIWQTTSQPTAKK